MEAKQGCKVQTCDTPNAFMQTKLDDIKERIILTLRGLAAESLCEIASVHKPFSEKEREQSHLHVEFMNVACRALKAALSFFQGFENDMEAISFKINLHVHCKTNEMVNGEQMMGV